MDPDAINDPSAEMARYVASLAPLNAAQREKLGLSDASSRTEAIEHVMWGFVERYMGLETPDVEYEMRTFRCKVKLASSTLIMKKDDDKYVMGIALPLGWQAKGFVRQVELYWPDGFKKGVVDGRRVSWSLPETKETKLPFDGGLIDFYVQGYADAKVRDVLAANGTYVSKLVNREYSELSWDSYTRRTMYVWFDPPLERGSLPDELPVRVAYYRAVFDEDDV